MAKKKRSYPKSPNFKIDFFRPSTTIYKKKFEYEDKPFSIEMTVKPQKPNEATIEMKERN